MEPIIPGVFTKEQPANEDIQKIADKVENQVKVDVENESGRKFTKFIAISYRSRLTTGVDYFIKVCVGDGQNDYILVGVYENPQGELALTSYRLDIKKDDPIEVIGD